MTVPPPTPEPVATCPGGAGSGRSAAENLQVMAEPSPPTLIIDITTPAGSSVPAAAIAPDDTITPAPMAAAAVSTAAPPNTMFLRFIASSLSTPTIGADTGMVRAGQLNGTMPEPEAKLKAAPRHRALALGTVPGVRVLIIEDDDAIRSVVERGLRAEGFEVDTCSDGTTGLWKALDGGYAAIVLDLLMPGMNGYTVCDHAPRRGQHHTRSSSSPPSPVSSTRSTCSTPAPTTSSPSRPASPSSRPGCGSSSGAPRRWRRTWWSAASCATTSVNASAPWPTSRSCSPAARTNCLRRLLLANGACVTRQELLDDVWGPDSGVDGSNLDIYVRRLRDKLAPVPIENVRGLGYRISAR